MTSPNQRLRRALGRAAVSARERNAETAGGPAPARLAPSPTTASEPEAMLTPADWARRLRLGTETIRRKMRSGEIPAFHLEGQPYLSWADAQAYVVARLGPAAPARLARSARRDPGGRLSLPELAQLLGESPVRIRAGFAAGEIPGARLSRGPLRSLRADFDRYVRGVVAARADLRVSDFDEGAPR